MMCTRGWTWSVYHTQQRERERVNVLVRLSFAQPVCRFLVCPCSEPQMYQSLSTQTPPATPPPTTAVKDGQVVNKKDPNCELNLQPACMEARTNQQKQRREEEEEEEREVSQPTAPSVVTSAFCFSVGCVRQLPQHQPRKQNEFFFFFLFFSPCICVLRAESLLLWNLIGSIPSMPSTRHVTHTHQGQIRLVRALKPSAKY